MEKNSVKGVKVEGVTKDKKIKLEEIEASKVLDEHLWQDGIYWKTAKAATLHQLDHNWTC